MRKVMYILLGIVLVFGAVGAFGVRQLGWEGPSLSRSERAPHSTRSFSRERSSGSWHGERGGRRDGSWLSFATLLDLLNVVVGVIGIVLTVIGMRMQRNAMHMSMRGRD
jgi:hypothetical protein